MAHVITRRIMLAALAAMVVRPSSSHAYEGRDFYAYFSAGSEALTADALVVIGAFADYAKLARDGGHPMKDIRLIGHADTCGAPDYNIVLSRRRAESVAAKLVELGLDASDLIVEAKGEADLMINTPDETPEPLNRRVQIVFDWVTSPLPTWGVT